MIIMIRIESIDRAGRRVYTDTIEGKELSMAKVSQAQLKAQAKYDAHNTRGIYIKLNIRTDEDIIDRLNSVSNRQGYIKGLIRDDIAKTEKAV